MPISKYHPLSAVVREGAAGAKAAGVKAAGAEAKGGVRGARRLVTLAFLAHYARKGTNYDKGECKTLWSEREQAMYYSIDCYLAARLALSASLHLDKQSSFCSAVSAEH